MDYNVRAATFTIGLVLSIGFLAPVAIDAAAPLPVGQREYEILYDRFERDETFARTWFDYQLGPYTRTDSTFSYGPFFDLRNLTDRQIQVFGFAAENFRATPDARGRMYALFRGGIVGRPLKNVYAVGQFYLDERKARDRNYSGKKWRGFAGDIDLAFLQYTSERFDLTAGRFSSFWGVRHSLVLGSGSHLDGFGYTLRWGRLSVSYRFAQLDQNIASSDTITQWPNRYFAGHRFDAHLSNAFRVGLFETVVFGGPGRTIDLFYLNPIIFYHGAQLNNNLDDNTFVGFDFTWKPRSGVKLYGQLLIDDIQLDHKTQGDQEPPEYGLLLGIYTASMAKNFDSRVEYTRVTNRTFNQILPRNRYLSRNQPLGDVLGNDYDRITGELIRWLKPTLSGGLQFSYTRRGEGRIDAPWSAPWLDMTGDYHEPFPTATVEKTGSASATLKGFVTPYLFTDLQAGVSRVVNYNHHTGDSRTLPFLDLYLSLYFSRLIGLD